MARALWCSWLAGTDWVSVGGCTVAGNMAIVPHQACNIGATYAMGAWVDGSIGPALFLALFVGLGGAEGAGVLSRKLVMASASVRASRAIHDRALAGVLAAECRWFDANPAGLVQNKLVRDLSKVDKVLPEHVPAMFVNGLHVAGVALVLVASAPWALAALLLAVVPYCIYIRRWSSVAYLSLVRLAATTRGPATGHMLEAVHGAPVINAYV